jgi:hypothetical protein
MIIISHQLMAIRARNRRQPNQHQENKLKEKTGNMAREGRPAYNTAPIRCGKLKCKWRGYEGELVGVASKRHGLGVTDKVCPTCGTHGYYHMTPREITAWERSKLAAGLAATAAVAP